MNGTMSLCLNAYVMDATPSNTECFFCLSDCENEVETTSRGARHPDRILANVAASMGIRQEESCGEQTNSGENSYLGARFILT